MWCCVVDCLVSVLALTVVVAILAEEWVGGGLAVSPGKPRVPHCEERPNGAPSRKD